jgi:DNA modification methylase
VNDRFINEITCGDCEQLTQELDDNSVDLLITSPPYNVDLGHNKKHKSPYDLYQDNKEHKDYIEWLTRIFSNVKSKMVSGGRVCINIGDGKNGSVPTHSDIIQFMTKELGYVMMTTLIWNKSQIGNRTSWGSYMSPSSPSFPSPFEYILVFAKDTKKKVGDKDNITVSKDEFIKNSLGMWTFAPETRQKKMGLNAMFPVELPRRLIQMLSYKNDVVMDIFSGLGTTCLTAKCLERQYIGFELSVDYCKKSRARVNIGDITA